MNRRTIYLILLPALLSAVRTRGENSPSAADLALSEASIARCGVYAGYYNPAALAGMGNPSAGTGILNKFMMQDNTVSGFAVAFPAKKAGVFGLHYQFRKINSYQDAQWNLAYAKKIGSRIQAAVQLKYISLTDKRDRIYNRQTLTGSVSFLLQPSSGLKIGACMENLNNNHYSRYSGERWPSLICLGFSWQLYPNSTLHFALIKKTLYSTSIKAGLEYRPADRIFLRLGISETPAQSSFGIGFRMKQIMIDTAVMVHPALGMSSACSIEYAF
jgi:hypothetical protein